YFTYPQGLLKKGMAYGPSGTLTQISFEQDAVSTSQRVKYSHHPDGNAQFSQDDQVYTTIRTRTRPLCDYSGHLFTVHFWGADGFDTAGAKDFKPANHDRAMLLFESDDQIQAPNAVAGRFIGWGYRVKEMRLHSSGRESTDFAKPLPWQVGGQTTRVSALL